MLADSSFLKNIFYFSKYEKDMINDETIEFMRAPRCDVTHTMPGVVSLSSLGPFGPRRGRRGVFHRWRRHESRDPPRVLRTPSRRQPYFDIEEYNTLVAKNASKAAEGLCAWTKAMCSYQAASKIVKPKLEALKLAEAKLAEAQKELDKAEAKLQGVMDVLNKLQKQFEDQMAVKAEIEVPSRRPSPS